MNNSAGIPGAAANAVDSIEPLGPGRRDLIPDRQPGSDDQKHHEREIPLEPDDEAVLETDTFDVDATND